MSVRIIALGRKMPNWVVEGYAEYAKRLPRDWQIELLELKSEKRDANRSATQALALEALRIRAQWGSTLYKIALDQQGKALTTEEFAHCVARARDTRGGVALVIGSADGLDAGIKSEADLLLSLSRFTLPHGLVRVMLAEQLYRAASLLQGHPYHRS